MSEQDYFVLEGLIIQANNCGLLFQINIATCNIMRINPNISLLQAFVKGCEKWIS